MLRRQTNDAAAGPLEVISGDIAPGEAASETAIRAACEAYGITVAVGDLHFVTALHRRGYGEEPDRIDVVFAADSWSGEVTNADPNAWSELVWCPINDLPDEVAEHVRYAVEQGLSGERPYLELGFAVIAASVAPTTDDADETDT